MTLQLPAPYCAVFLCAVYSGLLILIPVLDCFDSDLVCWFYPYIVRLDKQAKIFQSVLWFLIISYLGSIGVQVFDFMPTD